jgi:COP9 signalosome complex subunit 3
MYHFPAGPSHAYQAHRQFFLCSEHGSSAAYITHASGFTAQVTYKDHLQYFLYGAMIYMALKEWESALHLLRIVISCPVANTVSKIMVEAYKKWLLVSLLAKGKVISTPEMVNPHVMKVYRSLVLPYVSLADAFENDDTEILMAEVDIGRAIWLAVS